MFFMCMVYLFKEDIHLQIQFDYLTKNENTVDPNVPTAVFIDYESFYISHRQVLRINPDLKALAEDLREVGKISSIKVFAGFSDPELKLERNRIRTITNNIIDCSNEAPYAKKDFTDFIMLDHIYQEAIQNDYIRQFILVTGDGHFSSVATFLRMNMEKTVGVYSIAQVLSRQLQNCSSWVKGISLLDTNEYIYMKAIVNNLKQLEQEGKYATFNRTCEHISAMFKEDEQGIRRTLSMMVERGLVVSELVTTENVTFKRIGLCPDIDDRLEGYIT